MITLPQRGSARPSGAAGGFGNLQALSLAGGFRGQFQGKTSRDKEGRAAVGMRRWARWSAVSQGEGAARPGDRQPRSQGSGPALPGRRHSPSRPAAASLHTGLRCCCIRWGAAVPTRPRGSLASPAWGQCQGPAAGILPVAVTPSWIGHRRRRAVLGPWAPGTWWTGPSDSSQRHPSVL